MIKLDGAGRSRKRRIDGKEDISFSGKMSLWGKMKFNQRELQCGGIMKEVEDRGIAI